ncbi:MAG: hypothetical protein COT14_02410 [Candidatus Diapherotrites archaeon CG08_land_8_20_14_0_20_30_16]|nr:MAG: hypothetical protein COT14_02410 [Candidatus Diapherotrites archaeon CG08_land_8_20_14_0_20_30_16]
MVTLICSLSRGKGSWGHVTRMITDYNWDKIVLITNEWCKQNFAPTKEISWIMINRNMGYELMKKTIKDGLPEAKEVAFNMISGDGKEHMASMQAIRETYPDHYKLAILTKDGLKYY